MNFGVVVLVLFNPVLKLQLLERNRHVALVSLSFSLTTVPLKLIGHKNHFFNVIVGGLVAFF